MDTLGVGIGARRDGILRFCKRYLAEHGFSPSIQEIADDAEITKTAVRHHLDKLEAEGLISRSSGVYRSLRVL